MIWGKKTEKGEEKKEKLAGPEEIPGPVQNYLVAEKKIDPDIVKLLKAVLRKSEAGEDVFNIRIFDNSEAIAKKKQVKNYSSLDEYPDLIIYEGIFDKKSKQIKLEEKKEFIWNVPLLTQEQIQQKIEALSVPGETVFFYTARGGKSGGPLGMGAAVVELNPNYPGKKQKKYIVYMADVIDMKPFDKGDRIFDSDKSKDIAKWIKDAHHKRMY